MAELALRGPWCYEGWERVSAAAARECVERTLFWSGVAARQASVREGLGRAQGIEELLLLVLLLRVSASSKQSCHRSC